MREHPEKPIFGPEAPRLDPPNPPEIKAWRSVAKAVSWRIVGTLDTLLLSWLILTYLGPMFGMEEASAGENLETATYIAVTEVVTKMVLYFLHEQGWGRTAWGMIQGDDGTWKEGAKRSGVKTATWRVIASLDTFLLAYVFTGNIATAVSVGGLEILTKLVLYFFHERAWSYVPYGKS